MNKYIKICRRYYKRIISFIKQKPLTSFLASIFLLFIIIFLGNLLSRPKVPPITANPAKQVSLYAIGETPKATFQAKIDKPGVIKIVALTNGIVQNIYITEGSTVWQGKQLFTLSSSYQGGNIPALSAQIADDQYNNVKDTFNEQKSIIQKQRDIANATHDNFSDMQNIATQSAQDTNNLINANQTVLDQLNNQLNTDKQNSVPQSTIVTEETQINQLQGAQNQLRQALSNLHEQTDSSKPPGRLADTQHDLTIQQLDMQEKSLELNKEVSRLQANIADVTAAAMYPTSPFGGIIQRVYVRAGQLVTPGTPLAEISATKDATSALVDVPENILKNISPIDSSTLYIGNKSFDTRPTFVPTEATNGSLFTIVYPIPDTLRNLVSDGEYVQILIPVGNTDTTAAIPFIPLDAIYQTQDSNYVLLDQKNKAVVQKVSIGSVFGSFVEITQGLASGDMIILNRNIITGDRVKTE